MKITKYYYFHYCYHHHHYQYTTHLPPLPLPSPALPIPVPSPTAAAEISFICHSYVIPRSWSIMALLMLSKGILVSQFPAQHIWIRWGFLLHFGYGSLRNRRSDGNTSCDVWLCLANNMLPNRCVSLKPREKWNDLSNYGKLSVKSF